ncbi:unnamed protein product, partial [Mesorhabditis belari]|uniref:Uncharacterized protein n=1 Tax=Mesorhabditis belari TaxID=2138241 RepID=A0AAF3FHI9_9BILA
MALKSLVLIHPARRIASPLALRFSTFHQIQTQNVATSSIVRFSSTTSAEPFKPTSEGEKKREQQRLRRGYAIGGSVLVVWLSTHALLLWKRRNEHHDLNKKLPPMNLEDFVVKYLANGEVKTIVFQPSFNVANVYLNNELENEARKTAYQMFSFAPDRFARPPDVRFTYEGDRDSLQKTLSAALKAFFPSGGAPNYEFEIDQFPSYRELSFIIASTAFALVAVLLSK